MCYDKLYLTDTTNVLVYQKVCNIMHGISNTLSLAQHSTKKDLYTCNSNVHAISVDFFESLAKGRSMPLLVCTLG